MWLGKLTALDMTPLGWLGRKTSTQTNKPKGRVRYLGADPVGVGIGIDLTLSCLHNILWTSGWILTKFLWILICVSPPPPPPPPTHTHTHTPCTHTKGGVGEVYIVFGAGPVAISNCVRVCVHACVCVCVWSALTLSQRNSFNVCTLSCETGDCILPNFPGYIIVT